MAKVRAEDLVQGRRLTITPRDLELNLLTLIRQGLTDGDLEPASHTILSHAVRAARQLADSQREEIVPPTLVKVGWFRRLTANLLTLVPD